MGANVCGFRIETAMLALVEETLSALNNNIRSKEIKKDHTPMYYWIPARILTLKAPHLVQEFYTRTHIKKKAHPTEPTVHTL